ncbi:hypothetical protein AL08_00455 [Corynebacterium diphtheriae bv. gravis str. ISS 4746]|nr:hypothetical protein AL08_00455 [Corynebacterium diphtheriae bv. gravis str. ISS 4746]KLN45398.1 hypothetical protein AL09_00660 [Corynebacterium diphtheriae bv. gravis str. ISS 4749]
MLALVRIRELEFKTTKTQGRHFGEKIASCGFRVLEFEEAQKGQAQNS